MQIRVNDVESWLLKASFRKAEVTALPMLADAMDSLGRIVLMGARSRFVAYGSERSNAGGYAFSASHMQSASGVKADGSGVYASVGQTLPRRRGRVKWSLLQYQKALEPSLAGNEPSVLAGLEMTAFNVLKAQGLT